MEHHKHRATSRLHGKRDPYTYKMPSDTPKKLTFCMRLHQLSASAYTTPNLWFLSVPAALQLLCRVVLGADAWVPANTSQIHLVVRTCARPISFAHSILPFGVWIILKFYLFPCSGPFHIVHHIIRRQLCQSTPWVLGLNRAHVWAGRKAS